jgi:hypothetical protein
VNGRLLGDLEAAAGPLTPLAAFTHRYPEQLAEKALDCTAHLGPTVDCRREQATASTDHKPTVLLLDLVERSQILEKG